MSTASVRIDHVMRATLEHIRDRFDADQARYVLFTTFSGLHHAKACHVRVGRTHFIIHDAFLAKTPGETTTWQISPARLHPCVWLPVNFGKAGFIAASAERSMFAMHPPQVMGVQPLNDFHT
ncbi:hypothetical protein [Burkholderia vietnamiensis]|uniref:hypothetical protein n=1 Tax=Burkholderia vietnamiensis TaxID=60552 RepID=UPI00075E5616|nr:hypothetical protein [Burkholderia vietnamiensis]KVF71958.1 hypothetical protein WJ17_05705 [Burkholderia vietnamiensis]KVR80174.1 hypothetical protein WK27_26415 [Burkholderia vietnamiensis]MBR8162217.1 hypothetical protein [Burkholderia vietnamiensis]MCA8073969.1 hypothetical protein [Burkholderia vietnamiensis]MCA8144868.1 hypothetical protein [Burkholderia vietnamiensis]